MNLKNTELHILKQNENLSSRGKCGVSMHCHSEHSKEMLDFIPHYAEKIPVVSHFWKRESKRYREAEGKDIDFSTAYWSPPMEPERVFESEKTQINNAGLEAIVSLTDHDTIDGALQLNQTMGNARAPISFEWTVPFGIGFFHLGVHNLPADRAIELSQTLLDYTFVKESQNDQRLREIFAMLSELRGVLVVFNHPLWDIEIIGQKAHENLLDDFLEVHGQWIHAFEVNGFRSWSENKAVIDLANIFGLPIVTGGDRHGCKPNTVINLTNAGTFDEFVEEVRIDKHSEVVLMPEYEKPLHSRQLQSFSEILTNYPDFPESRRRWFDRLYFDINDGKGLVPLSAHGWQRGGPTWLRGIIWTLGFLGSPAIQPIFRVVRKKEDRVPHVVNDPKSVRPKLDNVSPTLSSETV